MSLLAQLYAAAPKPTKEKPTWKRNTDAARASRVKSSTEKYRTLLKKNEWTKTNDVSLHFGFCRSTCQRFLRKLEEQKLVKKRFADNAHALDKKGGYEWKWIGD